MLFLWIGLYLISVVISYLIWKRFMIIWMKEISNTLVWGKNDRATALFVSVFVPFSGLGLLIWGFIIEPILAKTIGLGDDPAKW